MKKIVLIHPNYKEVYKYVSKSVPMLQPPLGIAYIGTFLRDSGHQVLIIDGTPLDLDEQQITEKAISFSPDFIGITATTNLIEIAAKTADKIKEKTDIPIIIGGAHSSIMPEKTLEEFPSFDMAVKGEGEYVLLDLCNNIPKQSIPGLSYREHNKIIKNSDRTPITDLDALPFPDRNLLPYDKYWTPATRKYPYANIMTSRGCPYSCVFCSDHLIHGKKFRTRSIENIMKEIDLNVNQFGVKEINFIDDNFMLDLRRVEEICNELIERKYNLIWRTGGVRPDNVTKDILKLMKKSGCYSICMGIESGDNEVLKKIKKGFTTEEVKKAVKWAKEVRINTFGYFIIGNLGDTKKTIEKTIEFAKSLNLNDAQFQLCLPFPGTEFYNEILKNGKLLVNRWKDYAAYDNPIFTYENLTVELLKEMQVKAYRSYYLRPKMIIKKIFEIKSLKQLIAYGIAGLSILRLKKK